MGVGYSHLVRRQRDVGVAEDMRGPFAWEQFYLVLVELSFLNVT